MRLNSTLLSEKMCSCHRVQEELTLDEKKLSEDCIRTLNDLANSINSMYRATEMCSEADILKKDKIQEYLTHLFVLVSDDKRSLERIDKEERTSLAPIRAPQRFLRDSGGVIARAEKDIPHLSKVLESAGKANLKLTWLYSSYARHAVRSFKADVLHYAISDLKAKSLTMKEGQSDYSLRLRKFKSCPDCGGAVSDHVDVLVDPRVEERATTLTTLKNLKAESEYCVWLEVSTSSRRQAMSLEDQTTQS